MILFPTGGGGEAGGGQVSWSGSVEAVSQWSAAMLVQEYDISGTRMSRLSGHESVRQTSPPPRYFKHAGRPASRNGRQQVLHSVAAAYPRSTRLSAMPATSFPFPPQAPCQWRRQRVDVQKLCNMCVCFHCHGTSSYHTTNTKPYKFPMHCSKCVSFWGDFVL